MFQVLEVELSPEELDLIKSKHSSSTNIKVVQVSCHKPEFEVGSAVSLPLSFGKKVQQTGMVNDIV